MILRPNFKQTHTNFLKIASAVVLSMILFLFVMVIVNGCGMDNSTVSNREQTNARTNNKQTELEAKFLQLQGTITEIANLLSNDFTTCDASLDDFVENVCRMAQDANEEKRNLLKSELLSVINILSSQIRAISGNVGASTQKIQDINDSLYGTGNDFSCVGANTCTGSSIAGRLKQAETSITSLNNLATSIQTTQNRTLESVDVGVENLSAGPGYETLTRRVDRTKINGYVEAYGSALTVSSNGCNATNNSSVVTITTTTTHGLTVGQTVSLSNIAAGRGFSSGDLTGLFAVGSVPSTTTFTVTLTGTATSGGTFGGSSGVVTPLLQRAPGTVWKTADGEQSKVAIGGTVKYNFLVTGPSTVFTINPTSPLPSGWGGAATPGTGYVCYSTSSTSASAATIKAGGSSIICK
jgi:hypothetical protein